MKYSITVFILFFTIPLFGQDLYSDSTVVKIELQFSQPNFWQLLEQNKENKIDIPATMIVNDSETFDSVGVRFKGNSSYGMSDEKKPFNISMDSFIDNQDLWGYETFNLGNCFMDPTFVREKISYEIYRKYMAAGQAGYVSLYLNGEYWGLYVNVEQVNRDFLRKWFPSDEGNNYKGDPHGNLMWHGYDVNSYRRDYEKKTNEDENDWSDLIEMINVLNNSHDLENELPQVLNVDRVLWYIAISNILVNLDSYIFSSHNYYIYNSPTSNRFNIIPWDLNEAFGCFPPHSLSLQQLEEYSIYFNMNRFEFPLLNRILNIPAFRARFMAHYRTLLKYDFNVDSLLPRIEFYQGLIDSYVQSDTRKLYSYDFFKQNVTNPVVIQGNRTAPGLISFIENRRNYLLNDADILKQAPEINNVECMSENIQAGNTIAFNADVTDVSGLKNVNLYYKIGVDTFNVIKMSDDGLHNDNGDGDGVFGCELEIPPGMDGANLDYYVLAENQQGEMAFYPEGAEFVCLSLKIEGSAVLPDLVINEFMAGNDTSIADPQGNYDDWVEIYNRTGETISMTGMYLTDDLLEPTQWIFPDTFIAGYGYLLIWADSNPGDKPGLHANFKLSKNGEYIGLYDTDQNGNGLIDSYSFGAQQDDVSEGRFPNGDGNFTFMTSPTPNSENFATTGIRFKQHKIPGEFQLFQNYPNPFNSETSIRFFMNTPADVKLSIYNIQGKLIKLLIEEKKSAGEYTINWNGLDETGVQVTSGIYFYFLLVNNFNVIKKMILIQ